MARTLPVSPDSSVLHTSYSALASLGLEESVVALGSADGLGVDMIANAAPNQAPQLVPLWVPVEPGLENTSPVPVAIPVASVEAGFGPASGDTLSPADVLDGQVAESPSDPITQLIWVPVNVRVEARVEGVVAEHDDDLSFLDPKPSVEFRTDGFFGTPDSGAESMSFDAGAAAKGGPGGGGGGGGGDSGVPTEYKSGDGNGTDGYDIWIQFKGTSWTAELQSAFKDAANYFTTVITNDIGGGGRIGKVIVDDLLVTAEVKAIDGAGGILGQAGPSHVWTATQLTADGQMQFDVADAQNFYSLGLWDDIVTHELMHVLGFGSLWEYGNHDLVDGKEYTGREAVIAYNEVMKTSVTTILVEDEGGSGTAGSHWDEEALTNELMTGYIDDPNYLSKFSVMSLVDLGYTVEYQPLIT